MRTLELLTAVWDSFGESSAAIGPFPLAAMGAWGDTRSSRFPRGAWEPDRVDEENLELLNLALAD